MIVDNVSMVPWLGRSADRRQASGDLASWACAFEAASLTPAVSIVALFPGDTSTS